MDEVEVHVSTREGRLEVGNEVANEILLALRVRLVDRGWG
jgi:hypothetical protein